MVSWIKRLLRNWLFAVTWYHRSEPTPAGERIWASDGNRVWQIWGSGEPISEYAVDVLYWARAFAPEPPAPTPSKIRTNHVAKKLRTRADQDIKRYLSHYGVAYRDLTTGEAMDPTMIARYTRTDPPSEAAS